MVERKGIEEIKLLRQLRIIESRASFWTYCKAMAPDFYKEDRPHLKKLCNILQGLYEGTILNPNDNNRPYRRLMINMPPRHGKSRTLVLFCQWCLGVNVRNKIITCSYNDDLAGDFSRYTRDGIMTTKTDELDIVYSDIFPNSTIKRGNAGFEQWALEGQFFSYKGAGVGGSITGKGCNISIVDDPVKDAAIAYNENALNTLWQWYTGTFLSRNEEGGIQIVNMTRWSKKDICGRILDGEEPHLWLILKMEAYDEKTDKMLCPESLSFETYKSLEKNIEEPIFRANYHQEPVDIQGLLYKDLKPYTELPKDEEGNYLYERIVAYIDTADEGKDYLAGICAYEWQGELFIKDIIYTKEGMTITEPQTAKFLVENEVNYCLIESNNGGRGFARNVERIIWETYRTRSVIVKWFHQNKNKKTRILVASSFVMEHVYFPWNAKERWKEAYKHLNSYQKEGKNEHDDIEDALTGLTELIQNKINVKYDKKVYDKGLGLKGNSLKAYRNIRKKGVF